MQRKENKQNYQRNLSLFLDNRSMKELNLDFDRIYSTQTTKRKDRTKSQDESSLSGSDVALDEDGKFIMVQLQVTNDYT